MPIDITSLPDYPAITQLARALWRGENAQRGAAVFIGAGFSTNADRPAPDTPPPPLWSDLRDDMRKHLYPGDASDAPYDPLRLAEEYRTYLGQTALNDFLRTRIKDDAWAPGKIHRALLELPWSDIITTNWDTLLERGARLIDNRYYEPVRTITDLSHASAPRIIKLHGSAGTTDNFIFAEEDYRTYPVRFAPFVNVAKQVFIENELCLLGFSGDDPNFLQWSGWVRDEFKDNARRVYLVGALSLGPSKRKLLEARNVAPIDLSPLVADVEDRAHRHSTALELFLDFLGSAKPTPIHDWKPARSDSYSAKGFTTEQFQRRYKDMPYAATLLTEAMDIWKRDRECYPGWLLCPVQKRTVIRHRTDDAPIPTAKSLAEISTQRQAQLLYELVWRYRTSLWPLPQSLVPLIRELVKPDQKVGLSEMQQTEIAVILLRWTRINRDDAAFQSLLDVISNQTKPGTDLRAEAAYQLALHARDKLRLSSILECRDDLLQAPDPMWRIRLAALHSECGDFKEAKRLIGEATKQLRERQAQDRGSLWLRSRRAWAHWLSRAAGLDQLTSAEDEPWPREFEDAQCDPWKELDHLKQEINSALRKLARAEPKITPLFKAGSYKDNSATINIVSSTVTQPDEEFEAIVEIAGIPYRLEYANLVGDFAKDISEISFDPTNTPLAWYLRFLRSITSHSDPLLERFLGRLGVARLNDDVSRGLIAAVLESISFWRHRAQETATNGSGPDTFTIERIRIFIEVMARLTARQNEEDAAQSFSLASELISDKALHHFWLHEPIDHLAEYAVHSVSPAKRPTLVLDALLFPLSSEQTYKQSMRYPNPVSFINNIKVDRPQDSQQWTKRIKQLIESVRDGEEARVEAAMRLVHLTDTGLLTENEKNEFSKALWSRTDDLNPALPNKTHLLPHVYYLLPAPAGVDIISVIRHRVYNTTSEKQSDAFQSMLGASSAKPPIYPSSTRAQEMFDSLVAWRPRSGGESSIGAAFARAEERLQNKLLGQVLSEAIVPAMNSDDFTIARTNALVSLADGAEVYTCISALAFFASSGSDDIKAIAGSRLRRGLLGSHDDEVSSSIRGVVRWAERLNATSWPQSLRDLLSVIVSSLRNRRERDLISYLWGVRRICELGELSDDSMQVVKDSLRELFDETIYSRVEFGSETAITVSLVRAECVRISKILNQVTSDETFLRWLQAAAIDPLPEVRFASQ